MGPSDPGAMPLLITVIHSDGANPGPFPTPVDFGIEDYQNSVKAFWTPCRPAIIVRLELQQYQFCQSKINLNAFKSLSPQQGIML